MGRTPGCPARDRGARWRAARPPRWCRPSGRSSWMPWRGRRSRPAERPDGRPDQDLERALLGLRSDDRAALFLRFHEDLPLAEVASVLGLSMTATRSRIHRALRRMRADLEAEVDEA